MVESARKIGGELRLAQHLDPEQQQVVIVEHILRVLCLHIGIKQASQLVFPFAAPWKCLCQNRGERHLGVHRAGIDREARRFRREAALELREPQVMAHQVHQVGGIFAIVNSEARLESDHLRVFAQQPRANAMERACPGEGGSVGAGPCSDCARNNAVDAADHLGRRAPRKRQKENSSGIGALDHKMCDPVRERIGLARTRARNDKQRSAG